MSWQLVVETGARKGQVIPLTRESFLIGRDPSCQLRPKATSVSELHCFLSRRGDQLFVANRDSPNGTLVNGLRLDQEQELHDGDVLQIGPLSFSVKLIAAESIERLDETSIAEMLLGAAEQSI